MILSIFGLILLLFFVFNCKAYFVLPLQKLGAHFEIQDIRLYDRIFEIARDQRREGRQQRREDLRPRDQRHETAQQVIDRLRKKLDWADKIVTVPKVGYKLLAER